MSSLTKVLAEEVRKIEENGSSCQDDADKPSDPSSDAACGMAQ